MNKTNTDEANQEKIERLLIARKSLLDTIMDIEGIAKNIALSNESARTLITEIIFGHLDVMVKRGYLSTKFIVDSKAISSYKSR